MYTANEMYNYDARLGGATIDYYVRTIYSHFCTYIKKSNLSPPERGSFLYDSLVMMLMFAYAEESTDTRVLTKACHRAWKKNYKYWRDNDPFSDGNYLKPNNDLDSQPNNYRYRAKSIKQLYHNDKILYCVIINMVRALKGAHFLRPK